MSSGHTLLAEELAEPAASSASALTTADVMSMTTTSNAERRCAIRATHQA
jgi:hypothetical protein